MAGIEPIEPLAWTSNSGEENNSLDKKKQKKNKTKMFTSVASGLHTLAENNLFYFFFFISNLKDVGSDPENIKSIKFCLHK